MRTDRSRTSLLLMTGLVLTLGACGMASQQEPDPDPELDLVPLSEAIDRQRPGAASLDFETPPETIERNPGGPDLIVVGEANRRGFFSFLRRGEGTVPEGADNVLPPATEAGDAVAAPGEQVSEAEEAVVPAGAEVTANAAPPRRRGLFGWLRRGTGAAEVSDGDAGHGDVVLASAEATAEVVPDEAVEPPRRLGFFARLGKRRDAVDGGFPDELNPEDAAEVAAGSAVLRPGEMLRVCDMSRSAMGQVVDRVSSGYRLHDTAPGATGPRTQYLTGFRDGCARQFTAALAMFGSVEVHETTRYGALGDAPYTATDEAYEQVKARVCGVGRGEPCPDNRLRRLERKSAFLTVYGDFGDSENWTQLFLHDGRIVTQEERGG